MASQDEEVPLVQENPPPKRFCTVSKVILLAFITLIAVIVAIVVPISIVLSNEDSNGTVYHNAIVYTAEDGQESPIEAFAVQDGRFVAVGTSSKLQKDYRRFKHVDMNGQTILPGMTDAHCHVLGLGTALAQADLMGLRSVDDVIVTLQEALQLNKTQDGWLLGRGWDQTLWPGKEFPTKEMLDAEFPDTPIWLRRVDGHASWANSKAMENADIPAENPDGGEIIRDPITNEPTGVFVDTAMAYVTRLVPNATFEDNYFRLQLAVNEMQRLGITGAHDAGIDTEEVALFEAAVDADEFDIRYYGMISNVYEDPGAPPGKKRMCRVKRDWQTIGHAHSHEQECSIVDESVEHPADTWCQRGHLYYKDRLTIRSTKIYMDGALGSYGAALLDQYCDKNTTGLLRTTPEIFNSSVRKWMECDFQVNTHAIGDQANRVVLDGYIWAMNLLNLTHKDMRNRVEHAQIINPDDFIKFRDYNIIPSMQQIHAMSDRNMSIDRIGCNETRIRGAYAWKTFMNMGVLIPGGSDFPVERANPMFGLHAAVTRENQSGFPSGGWYPEQKMTRWEALQSFTKVAAHAAFQEDELGTIAPGKHADFIVIDKDYMRMPQSDIWKINVLQTYFGGKAVYTRE